MDTRYLISVLLAGATTIVAPAASFADDASDSRLEAAIKTEFVRQKGVAPTVRVHVANGVATLSGKVYSTFAQRRAEEVAEEVPGVKVVLNYTLVDFIPRHDRSIQQDVERSLASDETVESYKTSVAVHGGVVRLTGNVDSDVEKLAAERAAWDVAGVIAVENALTVAPPGAREDAEILEDVRHQLSWDPALDEEMLHVSVNDGRVFLTGAVGTVEEKKRAIRVAKVAGVRAVETEAVEVAYFARDDYRGMYVTQVGQGAATTAPAPDAEKRSDSETAALLPVSFDGAE